MSEQIKISISGMSCGGCVANAKKHLEAVDGVEQVEVSLEDKSAKVIGSASVELLISAVKSAGYDASSVNK